MVLGLRLNHSIGPLRAEIGGASFGHIALSFHTLSRSLEVPPLLWNGRCPRVAGKATPKFLTRVGSNGAMDFFL